MPARPVVQRRVGRPCSVRLATFFALAVILIVPMCLLAALIGVDLRGMDNDILVQVGFIVLIALAAKHAILIVEFAEQAEDERGLDRFAAVVFSFMIGVTLFGLVFTPICFVVARRLARQG